MTRETPTRIDQATLLVERTFGNEEALSALIAGGPHKEAIVQNMISEAADPLCQASLVKILFQTAAREGDQVVTDRRDAAVAILTDQTMLFRVVRLNLQTAVNEYLTAIQAQTEQNDPYSGSIDALLKMGEAMAPLLSQVNKKGVRRRPIIGAWERLAQQFPTKEGFYIREAVEKIENIMLPQNPRGVGQPGERKMSSNVVDRRKPSSVKLELDQAEKLKLLMKQLGISQKELAEMIGASQSWIFKFLTGASVRNLLAVRSLAYRLHRAVLLRQDSNWFEENGAPANELLASIIELIGYSSDAWLPIAEPGGSMPVDAINYIHRPQETAIRQILNRDAGHFRFSFLVTGPRDSGKSSLINYLALLAQGVNAKIVPIYCELVAKDDDVPEATEEAIIADYIVKSIASAWGLTSPMQDEISTIADVANWYSVVMNGAKSGVFLQEKRLLIFDGIEELQNENVKQRLLFLPEMMRNGGLNYPAGSAFVLVVTPETLALQRNLEESKIYHGAVRVGWFDLEQVKKLIAVLEIPNAKQLSQELFAQYGGQPALTHIAAMLLRDDPTLTPESIYQMALAGKGPFFKHVNGVRTLYTNNVAVFYASDPNISREQLDYLLGLGLFEINEEEEKRLLRPKSKFYRDLFSTLQT